MNNPVIYSVIATFLLLFSLSSWAENPTVDSQFERITKQGAPSALASIDPQQFTGKQVINRQGEEIGEVEKLVINTGNQQVYAVISMGGFFGIGSKTIAVAIDQLSQQNNQLLLSSLLPNDELARTMRYEEANFSAFEPVLDTPIQREIDDIAVDPALEKELEIPPQPSATE